MDLARTALAKGLFFTKLFCFSPEGVIFGLESVLEVSALCTAEAAERVLSGGELLDELVPLRSSGREEKYLQKS